MSSHTTFSQITQEQDETAKVKRIWGSSETSKQNCGKMLIYFEVVIFVFILLSKFCSFSYNIVYNNMKRKTAPFSLQLETLLLDQ